MSSGFRLVMRSGPSVGTAYPLEKSELFVGRDLGNDIAINDPEISRRHARIFLQGNSFVIEDLGSTNGTYVNGQRITGPYVLRPGEMVVFGEQVSLLFESAFQGQNATIASSSARSTAPRAAGFEASPPQQAPAQPAYAGQVPMQPEYDDYEQKRKFPVWLIIVIVFVLLLVCVCAAVFWFMPAEWWYAIYDILGIAY